MTVAKGADIPRERADCARDATEAARFAFNEWATIDHPHVPPDMTDATQVLLARWQASRFATVPTSDAIIGLGVIEELGEVFDDDAEPTDAVDGLGDVQVYAAQLCTANRLAIRPVIALAALYRRTGVYLPNPIAIAGRLAHVIGKNAQNTRGLGPVEAYRPALVDALAMMIAKALEDCELGHELTVNAAGVFQVIAREVMERKAGDAMIPPPPDMSAVVMDRDMIKAQALAQLGGGVDALAQAEAVEGPGDFTVTPQE